MYLHSLCHKTGQGRQPLLVLELEEVLLLKLDKESLPRLTRLAVVHTTKRKLFRLQQQSFLRVL